MGGKEFVKCQVNKIGIKALIVMLVLLGIWSVNVFASYGKVYETNDIADYGKIIGNFNNREPEAFIFSFFPNEIKSHFSDISYHYKAKQGDEFAYECYLEFVIEDSVTYRDFLESCTNANKSIVFQYNEAFMEYTISNILDIDWTSPNDKCGYPICYAEIGKILYCEEEQRIIFFALGTWDGGGTDTSELNYFFTKFDIDVIEYQLNAYCNNSDQDNGIKYYKRYELGMETPYPYPQ